MKPAIEELSKLSAKMETWAPQEILAWAWETYGDKLTMATAFGAEGCAIIAMLADIHTRKDMPMMISDASTEIVANARRARSSNRETEYQGIGGNCSTR